MTRDLSRRGADRGGELVATVVVVGVTSPVAQAATESIVETTNTRHRIMYQSFHSSGVTGRYITQIHPRDRQIMMRRQPRATFVAPPLCGTCQTKMVPIVYGYPGDGLMEAAERGEVVLGGCVIWPNQPRWKCLTCKESSGG